MKKGIAAPIKAFSDPPYTIPTSSTRALRARDSSHRRRAQLDGHHVQGVLRVVRSRQRCAYQGATVLRQATDVGADLPHIGGPESPDDRYVFHSESTIDPEKRVVTLVGGQGVVICPQLLGHPLSVLTPTTRSEGSCESLGPVADTSAHCAGSSR